MSPDDLKFKPIAGIVNAINNEMSSAENQTLFKKENRVVINTDYIPYFDQFQFLISEYYALKGWNVSIADNQMVFTPKRQLLHG